MKTFILGVPSTLRPANLVPCNSNCQALQYNGFHVFISYLLVFAIGYEVVGPGHIHFHPDGLGNDVDQSALPQFCILIRIVRNNWINADLQ